MKSRRRPSWMIKPIWLAPVSIEECCCSEAEAILVGGACLGLLEALEALVELAGYGSNKSGGRDLILAAGARSCARGCV